MFRPMCNALSPEKAVIWTVLHGLAPTDVRCAHFTHGVYQSWCRAVRDVALAEGAISYESVSSALKYRGETLRPADERALRRLLRLPPPPRIRDNAELLVQALRDRQNGRRMHIEKLIN